jgi:hypothetical protein
MGDDPTEFIYPTAKHEPDLAADHVFPLFPEKLCSFILAGFSKHHGLH